MSVYRITAEIGFMNLVCVNSKGSSRREYPKKHKCKTHTRTAEKRSNWILKATDHKTIKEALWELQSPSLKWSPSQRANKVPYQTDHWKCFSVHSTLNLSH